MQASPPNFPVYPTGFLTRKSAETVRQKKPTPHQEIKRKSLHSTQCNNNKNSK